MNELALFNDLFDGFGDDGFLMPSFNYKKVFAPKVDVKEEKDEYSYEQDEGEDTQGNFYISIIADNKERAIKIGAERRAMYLAQKYGL